MKLFFWIHHTGRFESNTGVQRVVRNLAASLLEAGHELIPVRWCVEREAIVHAEQAWLDGLSEFGGPDLDAGHHAGTPLHLASGDRERLDGTWLLIPEVPHVGTDDVPSLAVALDYARFYRLRSALLFYDIIPLRRPGYESMANDHETYTRALVAADLVLAISSFSRDDLQAWWEEHSYEWNRLPRVVALPLPHEVRGVDRVTSPSEPPKGPICFAALGSIEPRKNQVRTASAFARLCARRPDLALQFDLVGWTHPTVEAAIQEIARREPRIRIRGYLSDDQMQSIVSSSHATVFTSLYEGFGLPVAESLWLGRPCLCSNRGSIAEIAAGGGCLEVSPEDDRAIELAFERLAEDPTLRTELAIAACTRPLRTWRNYADDVMAAIDATPPVRHVVALEGSRGSTLPGWASRSGLSVRQLRWRTDTKALLPATADPNDVPDAGPLDGTCAVLPYESCGGDGEALQIITCAHGLGLDVAVTSKELSSPRVVSEAELSLFSDDATRETALANALRELPKTVGVRAKCRVSPVDETLDAVSELGPTIASAGAPRYPERLLYAVDATSEQRFNTGVQRVVRRLGRALHRRGVELIPVRFDGDPRRIAPVSAEGLENLGLWGGPRFAASGARVPIDFDSEWLLLPEIDVSLDRRKTPAVSVARDLGLRCASIFYDLIPERMPEMYSASQLDAMRRYWRSLASVDLILAISWTAASDLAKFLERQGLPCPPIVPCPLAGDAVDGTRQAVPRPVRDPTSAIRLLAVGTWEPRKNHVRLLRALSKAQQRATRPITLALAGRRAGYTKLEAEIETLASQANVEVLGEIDDAELFRRYDESDATVFSSWDEGFGLPVLESLSRDRPCVCHAGSAMAELIPGGGVLGIDMLDEGVIAETLVRLADESSLLARLTNEAVSRPVRNWDEYASDVMRALARAGSPPGWPLPAVAKRRSSHRPLLSCAITTYNRSGWLRRSLPRLLEVTRPWRDIVEVVVCDNASTDETPEVVATFEGEQNFRGHRNRTNVGMVGNLSVTAQTCQGAFVWMLGDDDLVADRAIENILQGITKYPHVEMAYLNYAYTHFEESQGLDASEILAAAAPIGPGGPNRLVDRVRDIAGLNENLFTAIYACVFRRDHALRAFQLDARGDPFTSLVTCVPSSVYALSALSDRPAWWVGDPAVVVNMNTSWQRWVLLWRLERMPDLYDEAERRGIDPDRLDLYRLSHLHRAEQWVRQVYFEAEDVVRANFSLARLLERSKHLEKFRSEQLAGVREVYNEAWEAGRVIADDIPAERLFSRYGL